MYQPKHFSDPHADALAIAEQIALAALICSHQDTIVVNHIPFYIDRDKHCLVGHLARANPDLNTYTATRNVCAVFNGPHGYISPNYYLSEQVPTWNYSVVHIHGLFRLIDDTATTKDIITHLSDLHEARFSTPWKIDKLSPQKTDAMLRAIIGVEIQIERVELKQKLSQNRDSSDRNSLLQQLQNSTRTSDQLLAEWMIQQRIMPS